mmetsp:Transcript_98067/g.315891  ORF Transcript_98067/g.315891 Transcript_98067/m.315891 type:complete len:278 (-) Transcript_98067:560-1393(-)
MLGTVVASTGKVDAERTALTHAALVPPELGAVKPGGAVLRPRVPKTPGGVIRAMLSTVVDEVDERAQLIDEAAGVEVLGRRQVGGHHHARGRRGLVEGSCTGTAVLERGGVVGLVAGFREEELRPALPLGMGVQLPLELHKLGASTLVSRAPTRPCGKSRPVAARKLRQRVKKAGQSAGRRSSAGSFRGPPPCEKVIRCIKPSSRYFSSRPMVSLRCSRQASLYTPITRASGFRPYVVRYCLLVLGSAKPKTRSSTASETLRGCSSAPTSATSTTPL